MTIYISGAISGIDNYRELFENAEKFLKEKYPNAKIINPVKIPMGWNPTYSDYMRADIKELLRCDTIYLLKNWRKSNGAKCEYRIAKCCDMVILHE